MEDATEDLIRKAVDARDEGGMVDGLTDTFLRTTHLLLAGNDCCHLGCHSGRMFLGVTEHGLIGMVPDISTERQILLQCAFKALSRIYELIEHLLARFGLEDPRVWEVERFKFKSRVFKYFNRVSALVLAQLALASRLTSH